MNLPFALSPANSRGPALSFPSAVGPTLSNDAGASGFGSVLDRAVSPAQERAMARTRYSRDQSTASDEGQLPRTEIKPAKVARKKARDEGQEDLAVAGAVVLPPPPGVEINRCQGQPPACRTPNSSGDMSEAAAAAELTAESGAVTEARESSGADVPAGTAESLALLTPASAEPSTTEMPDAHLSGADKPELVPDGQATVDIFSAAGTEEWSETVPMTTAPTPPLQTDRADATPGRPTLEGLVELQPELVAGGDNSRGIAAAKVEEQMKNTVKQDEIAGSAKQVLPGAQAVLLRPARVDARREGRRYLDEFVLSDALAGAVGAKAGGGAASSDLLLATDVLPGSLSQVDRMRNVMTREVQIFKRTADESMEVMLTPDQNTQISLRLQWREGRVEILAHCHQGDFQTLSTHWPQLQSAFAQQGVRLAQLTQPAHTGYTEFFNSAGFAQSQNGQHRQSEPKVVVDKLPSVAVIPPAGKVSPGVAARPRHLLESWA